MKARKNVATIELGTKLNIYILNKETTVDKSDLGKLPLARAKTTIGFLKDTHTTVKKIAIITMYFKDLITSALNIERLFAELEHLHDAFDSRSREFEEKLNTNVEQ